MIIPPRQLLTGCIWDFSTVHVGNDVLEYLLLCSQMDPLTERLLSSLMATFAGWLVVYQETLLAEGSCE